MPGGWRLHRQLERAVNVPIPAQRTTSTSSDFPFRSKEFCLLYWARCHSPLGQCSPQNKEMTSSSCGSRPVCNAWLRFNSFHGWNLLKLACSPRFSLRGPVLHQGFCFLNGLCQLLNLLATTRASFCGGANLVSYSGFVMNPLILCAFCVLVQTGGAAFSRLRSFAFNTGEQTDVIFFIVTGGPVEVVEIVGWLPRVSCPKLCFPRPVASLPVCICPVQTVCLPAHASLA